MAALGTRSDPVPAFNFYISLIDSSSLLTLAASAIGTINAGGFTECTGLEGTLQIEEYSEGGENGFVHKFPTRMSYANITLKRGVTFTEDLWNWHYDYATGRGKRRDGMIVLRNERHEQVKVWTFKRGLPLKWSGPSLNASQSAIAIETLEIAHEGLELASAGSVLQQLGVSIVGGLG